MENVVTKNRENDVMTTENSEQRAVGTQERTVSPRASVYEVPEAVILELEMPGVNRENIEVKVENDELTVMGRRFIPSDEGLDLLHQERLPYSYKRAFILSDRIDSGNISAACTNGVLKLTLPKSAQAQPKKITIE